MTQVPPPRQATALVPAALALLALALQWGTPAFVRIPSGLALALVLPGLALTGTLFGHRVLSTVERFILPVALSVAVLVLGGLAMAAVGIELRRGAWAVLTTTVTVVGAGAGWWRRRRVGAGSADETRMFGKVAVAERAMSTRRDFAWRLLPLALALVLLTAAGADALRSAQQDRTPFTALSLVPEATADGDATPPLVLTVRCEERGPTGYTLTVSRNGGQKNTYSVTLRPGGTWTKTVTAPASGTLTAELFRGSDGTAYRTVHWSAEQR